MMVWEDVNHLVNGRVVKAVNSENAATPQSRLKCLLCVSLNDFVKREQLRTQRSNGIVCLLR